MAITAMGVSAGATLAKLLTDMAEAISRKKDPELLAKFRELQVQLSHVIQESVELRDKIRELRDRSKAHEGLTFDQNVWWLTTAEGGREGPFYPMCLGKDDRRQRMALGRKIWGCQVCGCKVDTPERTAEIEKAFSRADNFPDRSGDSMPR